MPNEVSRRYLNELISLIRYFSVNEISIVVNSAETDFDRSLADIVDGNKAVIALVT